VSVSVVNRARRPYDESGLTWADRPDRPCGKTPLLFTALFSDCCLTRNLMKPTPSLAVLIYDFNAL
jgi:hypothetical protein